MTIDASLEHSSGADSNRAEVGFADDECGRVEEACAREGTPDRSRPEWVTELEREQSERALSRLEATGEVTPTQRRLVERLARAVVEELSPAVEGTLRAADEKHEVEPAAGVRERSSE